MHVSWNVTVVAQLVRKIPKHLVKANGPWLPLALQLAPKTTVCTWPQKQLQSDDNPATRTLLRPSGLIELSSHFGAKITVNSIVILVNWQRPVQQLDLPLLVSKASVSQRQMVQGPGHVKVILCDMLFLHLQGVLLEFLRLFVVFELSVGVAQVPQSACHTKMILSVMPFLYLEGAFQEFHRLFVVFELPIGAAQVIQSGTNVARIKSDSLLSSVPFRGAPSAFCGPQDDGSHLTSCSTSSQLGDDALRIALL